MKSHLGLSTARNAWPLSADTLAVCGRQTRLARERMVTVYASNDGSDGTENEDNDLIARLKAAEEEAKALKQELNRVQSATTKVEEGSYGTKSPPSAVSRIDGADLRRETLSFVENKPRNWLSESDIEFFTGGGPSEGGTLDENASVQGVGASKSSEDAVVQRRLAIGLGLSVVLGAFALVPTEKLQPAPSKPLFFYLVPLIRTQEILKEVIDTLPDGDYQKLRALLSRIEGAPNNVQENLKSAVASIADTGIAGKVDLIARDAYEYVKGIDYQTYYDSRSMEGQQLKEMFDFSSNSAKAAQRKLEEFLSLMPEDEVMAARQQVSQSYY